MSNGSCAVALGHRMYSVKQIRKYKCMWHLCKQGCCRSWSPLAAKGAEEGTLGGGEGLEALMPASTGDESGSPTSHGRHHPSPSLLSCPSMAPSHTKSVCTSTTAATAMRGPRKSKVSSVWSNASLHHHCLTIAMRGAKSSLEPPLPLPAPSQQCEGPHQFVPVQPHS